MRAIKNTLLIKAVCLILFVNLGQAQTTVLPLSDFKQIELNGSLSLYDITESQTMEQTLNSQLPISFNKDCSPDPLAGSSCKYRATGFELSCYGGIFLWMDITGSNFYLRYKNQNITIGENISEIQSLFPTAYSRIDTWQDKDSGVIYKQALLTIGVAESTTTLSLLYDNQANTLKRIILHDEF